jgi:uncharacterized protein (TIGR02246 family)
MKANRPEDVDRLFGECINAGDIDGVVDLYEPGATLVTQDAGTLVGHQAIRGYLEALSSMRATIDMGTIPVVPLDEGLAVTHHDFHGTVTAPDGQTVEMSGKATEVVRRQSDGSCRFVLDDPNMRG